jgi:hypothetical protein
MAGGVLQLVTKGIENVFLNSEPQITFFKTIYRRHTNFSRTEFDLNFTDGLNFGNESVCRIKKYGDLLHRIYLVLTLPKIDLVYRSLLIRDIIDMFNEISIDIVLTIDFFAAGGVIGFDTIDLTPEEYQFLITSFHDPNNVYTEEINTVFIKFLNGFVAIFERTLAQVNEVLRLLQPGEDLYFQTFFDKTGSNNSDVNEYIDYVILRMFEIDTIFEMQYDFVDAQSKDRQPPRRMANADEIKALLFEKLADYVTGATDPNFDPNSFNDENLFFLYTVQSANYVVNANNNIQQNASDVFRAGVSNAYGNIVFTNLDAFKIFDATLKQTNAIINNNFDVEIIKQQLVTAIRLGLVKNIKLMRNIYNSLQDDARFMFFRLFQSFGDGTFNTNSQWQNVSLFTIPPPGLSDNFTSDFNLPPEPNEPPDFYHPFSAYTKEAVNNYHVDNQSSFRTLVFNDYFNSLFLWDRTNIFTAGRCIEAITGSPTGTIPPSFNNIYFLDYVPFLATEDIPRAIQRYLIRARDSATQNGDIETSTNIQGILDALIPRLNTTRDNLIVDITPKICIPDDFVVSQRMAQFRTSPEDIIMTAVFRQHEFFQFAGQNLLIPDYIFENYRLVINALSSLNIPGYEDFRETILDIVGLFGTPLNEIPQFAVYNTQNFNQRADLIINDQNLIFSDVQSALWSNIFRTVVGDYNRLYNNTILSKNFYTLSIGSEMLSYLTSITENILSLVLDDNINYYAESVLNNFQSKLPVNGGQIGVFLNNKLAVFQAQLKHFDRNVKLLNIRNVFLPQPEFYFAQFKKVLDEFVFNNIESKRNPDGTLVFDHQQHGTPEDPVINIYNSMIDPNDPNFDPNEPHLNAMDIIDEMNVLFEQLITSTTNPFSIITDPNKHEVWNEFWLPVKSFDTDFERDKYNFLYGTTTAEEFFDRLDLINTRYNGFAAEDDEYQLLKDVATDLSLAQGVVLLARNTVIETYNAIVEEFKLRQEDLAFTVTQINGGIITKLNKSLLAGQQANFAWIKKIGHYIIDHITVKIGDQVVDKHFGEWMEIWHQLTRKESKEKGYRILIGDVEELTVYNNQGKESYEVIVPIQFWFCRNVGASLPIVALNHTWVEIVVKLKELAEVSFFEDFTEFRRKPTLTCRLLAEYFYVENDERDRIVTAKNEYLIETLQYNDQLTINNNSFDDQNNITAKLYFKNTVKELFWVFQNEAFINGSQPLKERKYFNYTPNFVTNTGNIARISKIKFNSRDREVFKETVYYNYIQPYERHYASPETGVQIYCFSLSPENYQPSGSANMGRIDDSSIVSQLEDNIMVDIQTNKSRYQWRIYALSYNILRVMSGLAGVVYYR